MNEKQLEEMSSFDWGDIYKQLTAMSIYWSKVFFAQNWNNLPKGYSHEDLVQEAIRRAMDRDWTEFSKEILLKYLFGSIRSIVSNLRRSERLQKTSRLSTSEDLESSKISTNDTSELESVNFKIDYNDIIEAIEHRINGDSDLMDTFNGIRMGKTPKEIATSLKKTVSEVYNLKKRLTRLVDDVVIKYTENG